MRVGLKIKYAQSAAIKKCQNASLRMKWRSTESRDHRGLNGRRNNCCIGLSGGRSDNKSNKEEKRNSPTDRGGEQCAAQQRPRRRARVQSARAPVVQRHARPPPRWWRALRVTQQHCHLIIAYLLICSAPLLRLAYRLYRTEVKIVE